MSLSPLPATARKRGRKAQHYTTTWDEPIYGLARRPSDSRWRIIGTDITFSEPDERLAVHRFRQWKAEQQPKEILLPVAQAKTDGQLLDALAATKKTRNRLLIVPTTTITSAGSVTSQFDLFRESSEPAIWAWVREKILASPQYAAKATGIEWLAWGPTLTRPAASPTLEEVGKTYTDRNDISEKEITKCRAAWKDFSRVVVAPTLREITPELVARWGMAMKKRDVAPKTVAHAFNRIKTILNHFRQTGRCLEDIRHALDCTAVLKTPRNDLA